MKFKFCLYLYLHRRQLKPKKNKLKHWNLKCSQLALYIYFYLLLSVVPRLPGMVPPPHHQHVVLCTFVESIPLSKHEANCCQLPDYTEIIYITPTTSTHHRHSTQHSLSLIQSSQNMKMIKNSQGGLTFLNRIAVTLYILLADTEGRPW